MKKTIVCLERSLACGLLIVYCGWNAYWIGHWQVPQSLFRALTGLPCPTTGGTRSLVCLFRGGWEESFRWNVLTVPIIVFFTFTLSSLVRCLIARKPLRLNDSFLLAWAVLLAVAWVCKLLGNSNYW